jgi:asparagine synthase (glutamine-hydrolysing)
MAVHARTVNSHDAFWHYMSLRFIPDQHTLFEGIQKLPAASTLVWDNGAVSIDSYWSLNFTDKETRSEEAIADELEHILRESVQLHLLSDVQVGSFLSGGIDSSLITAMMADITGEKFPTFSIGVKEQTFNELPYARMVSDKYQLDAKEEIVQADLIRLMPSMIYHLDEPSDPFGVGVYLVSKVASEHVKVVLSGDGGDENFAGYDRFAGQRLAEYYGIMPEWFRKQVMRRMIKLVPESFAYKSLQQKAMWMNEMSFYGAGERYAQSMSFLRFTPENKQSLFTDAARNAIEGDSVEMILRYFDAENADDVVDKMLYTDLMTRMPDHLLSIVDRMSMAHSLESRPPLMDHQVIEYAARIPASMKLRGKNLKYMLKKVASRYLPNELIYRKKQGFSFPIASWLRTDLQQFTRNLFEQSRFVELGYFERAYVDQLLEEHVAGKMDHNFRIWILINMEFWYRMYFEDMSVSDLERFVDELIA